MRESSHTPKQPLTDTEAEALIDRRTVIYPLKVEHGKVMRIQRFPHGSTATKLAQQLTRLEQEFGMTPSARTRIQVHAQQLPPSPKDRFFMNAS